MDEKNYDFYSECDRYKRYLDSLTKLLAVKSIGGRYTKAYKKLKEKFDKVSEKWKKMCEEANKKQKLNKIGIMSKPQRDIELYRKIQEKAKKK